MLPFADGSDLGASLRNPRTSATLSGCVRRRAAFRMARWSICGRTERPRTDRRTAQETALLLFGQAGGDRRVPTRDLGGSRPVPELAASQLRGCARRVFADARRLAGEQAVRETIEAGLHHFEALGCVIEEAEPDLREADACFDVIRGLPARAELRSAAGRRIARS
jgi:amidase